MLSIYTWHHTGTLLYEEQLCLLFKILCRESVIQPTSVLCAPITPYVHHCHGTYHTRLWLSLPVFLFRQNADASICVSTERGTQLTLSNCWIHWTDRQTSAHMHTWMNAWTNEYRDRWTKEWIVTWIDRCMDRGMNVPMQTFGHEILAPVPTL